MVVGSFCHPNLQDDIRTGSTLYVEGSNGGTNRHSQLVCLAVQHLHTNVQHGEASAFPTYVCLVHTCHAGSSISHLDMIEN